MRTCEICGGSGELEDVEFLDKRQTCTNCGGIGRLPEPATLSLSPLRCYYCQGTGIVRDDDGCRYGCGHCGGTGRRREES